MVEFHKNTDESLVADYVLPDLIMTTEIETISGKDATVTTRIFPTGRIPGISPKNQIKIQT